MTTVVRCPRTGRACSEEICRERHWCRKMLERGLSRTGLPLKRKFRPKCRAKTRAGAPCITRVVPGKRRCSRRESRPLRALHDRVRCRALRRIGAEAALVAVEGFEAKFPPRNDEAAADAAV